MDISNITKNPLATSLMGFIGGLIIGLFLLGWVIWPVRWENATFKDLSPKAKQAYVVSLADSLAANPSEAADVVERFKQSRAQIGLTALQFHPV